jgi:hypothetical protein
LERIINPDSRSQSSRSQTSSQPSRSRPSSPRPRPSSPRPRPSSPRSRPSSPRPGPSSPRPIPRPIPRPRPRSIQRSQSNSSLLRSRSRPVATQGHRRQSNNIRPDYFEGEVSLPAYEQLSESVDGLITLHESGSN